MTVLTRREAALGLALAAIARPAPAQEGWPRHSITILVPAAAGGATDIIARIVAARLQRSLGVPVVIDNRGGAGGSLATEAGAAASPDGYVLTMGQLGTLAVSPNLYPKIRYDPVRDFAPVALVAQVPMVLVVHPSLGAQHLRGLIERARAAPRAIEYGSAGVGAITHIGMVAFEEAAGIKLLHVPFRGSGALLPLLLSGEIKAAFAGTPSMLPHIREGRLIALGISSPARLAALPEVPAMAEVLPGFDVMQWYGLVAPKRTPKPILDRLTEATNEAVASPEMAERLAEEGAVPEVRTPEEFSALIASELRRWGEVVRRNNLQPDG
ncbi:Bug family tripartite tricarboxylate transporter substrate binding protein [Muricoccus pecuniae]|uniref:Tripartite-type tricarboxylate transporter receptor subunit TctC n=1 Tax=Muricoccus pecuniae TaxID=693023 RepID=A0A840YBT9_9PROT|nr:tripartite tricarboxylate transporter substrate binding protein [Roseomonas pecuniae]MBB5696179.1 tripartite-type tricarboxylate transporter receptor subunit TctC [Roseomonas pecuniae]